MHPPKLEDLARALGARRRLRAPRRARRLSDATEDEFSPLSDLLAAGMTDYAAIITRFGADGIIGEMDGVYSSWTTGSPVDSTMAKSTPFSASRHISRLPSNRYRSRA
jgi:hypothetical protein